VAGGGWQHRGDSRGVSGSTGEHVPGARGVRSKWQREKGSNSCQPSQETCPISAYGDTPSCAEQGEEGITPASASMVTSAA
jgi:hypothetical protein